MAPSTATNDGRVTALRRKLQRKLETLGYNTVETASELSWVTSAAVVTWLEDRVIRHDPIEKRQALREAASPLEWVDALNAYLERVGCPIGIAVSAGDCVWNDVIHEPDAMLRVLVWLAARAITLEFEENAEKINVDLREDPVNDRVADSSQPAVGTAATISSTLMQAVEKLAREAGVEWDASRGLQPVHVAALRKVLRSTPTSANSASSGIDQRAELSRAIERLRLFYINDLKSLQLESNRILAKAQEFTANPRTDTSLGKTGF